MRDLYILSRVQDACVRYAPLYITRFALNAPWKQLEAQRFQNKWGSYDQIPSVPDRLRWLRHSRGLMQKEVAEKIGMSHHAYMSIEEGTTRRFGKGMRERLAGFFGVPASDFEDEFNRFCEDGQGSRIQAWRSQTGLNRQAFAERYGIPLQSLKGWENEKRAVTYKSWEKYFKGRL